MPSLLLPAALLALRLNAETSPIHNGQQGRAESEHRLVFSCRVTLSDDEAKRRKGPKTVIERMAPPTFDVAVEIIDRCTWRVHLDLAAAVDAALKGARPARPIHPSACQQSQKRPPAPILIVGSQQARLLG